VKRRFCDDIDGKTWPHFAALCDPVRDTNMYRKNDDAQDNATTGEVDARREQIDDSTLQQAWWQMNAEDHARGPALALRSLEDHGQHNQTSDERCKRSRAFPGADKEVLAGGQSCDRAC